MKKKKIIKFIHSKIVTLYKKDIVIFGKEENFIDHKSDNKIC